MVVRRARPTPLPSEGAQVPAASAADEAGSTDASTSDGDAAGPQDPSDPLARTAASLAPVGLVDRTVRFLRGMGVATAIVFFWSGALVLAWLVVPYVYLAERGTYARRRRMQRVVAAAWRWFLRMLEVLTLYRCAYQGEAPPSEPVVLVANHPSLLDVTAIIGRMPHVCCVVKSSLMNSPLVGRLLRSCGHVAAGDGSLMSGLSVLEAVRARLDEGFSVLVFPEGTRSPFGGMHRFRRGAFEVAQRANVAVVPLFLRCDPPALGKGTPVWQHPRRCPTLTVHVGAALDTNGRNPTVLCKNVERDFRARLGQATATGDDRT